MYTIQAIVITIGSALVASATLNSESISTPLRVSMLAVGITLIFNMILASLHSLRKR